MPALLFLFCILEFNLKPFFMKKITFLALLGAFSMNAQTYCTINPDFEGVEEITSVGFGSTTFTNTNSSSIYVDLTSTIASVSVEQSYNLTVKGNTNGPYENEFVAYIDWNHNGTLNDDGEVYYIGLIEDSDGEDTKFVSTNITIPANALTGNTRIRIMKVYTDVAYDWILNYDPCYVSIEDIYFDEILGSYGQVIDFTLNVSSLNRDAFDKNTFVVYPNPASTILNIDTSETVDAVSVFNIQGQMVLENKGNEKINVEHLAAGTYFIKIDSGKLSQTKKFVKI